MNIDNNPEKLEIIPEKIIHILLKHLMVLKNENAYLKNYMGINSIETAIPEIKDGAKHLTEAMPEIKDGAKHLTEAIPEIKDGEKHLTEAMPEIKDGEKNLTEAMPEIKGGEKHLTEAISEIKDGEKHLMKAMPEIKDGAKRMFGALPDLKEGVNADNLVYTVFEQGLFNALGLFIRSGDGQNTLYSFYTDFLEAVEEKNNEAEKIKAAAVNVQLEDTHILPEKLNNDGHSCGILAQALRVYLPRTSRWDLADKVASELLLLHNLGKATTTQLRECAGLSKTGFAKHLLKLQRCGLMKKQPPSNYALTEISAHILLQLFGVPKEK